MGYFTRWIVVVSASGYKICSPPPSSPKPACSFSVAVMILFGKIRLKTLLVDERSVTPFQFSQMPESPFFFVCVGSLTINPVFHTSRIFRCPKTLCNILRGYFSVSLPSASIISTSVLRLALCRLLVSVLLS